MASGESLVLAKFSRMMSYRVLPMRETRERDRSLPGKARIKARRANRTKPQ